MNTIEIVFIIFATAFALEEYTASREHGWESMSFFHATAFRRSYSLYCSIHSQCEVHVLICDPFAETCF